jgi:large subunit ribosomal protein L18
VFSLDGASTVASASTLEKDVRSEIGYGGNRAAAAVVGRIVAERAVRAGVERVAFDRSGFRYHGRIEALADAAREAGLVF